MRRIHIVGGKNQGKTTLVAELVIELTRRGWRVGTIKHTHHQHELDVPGKDSFRHREAGAAVVGILTRSLNAVFWSNSLTDGQMEPLSDTRYERFSLMYKDCDLIVVEGDTRTAAPKLEVWRAELATPPMTSSMANVLAVISDDRPPGEWHVLPRGNISQIADFIVSHFQLVRESDSA